MVFVFLGSYLFPLAMFFLAFATQYFADLSFYFLVQGVLTSHHHGISNHYNYIRKPSYKRCTELVEVDGALDPIFW